MNSWGTGLIPFRRVEIEIKIHKQIKTLPQNEIVGTPHVSVSVSSDVGV